MTKLGRARDDRRPAYVPRLGAVERRGSPSARAASPESDISLSGPRAPSCGPFSSPGGLSSPLPSKPIGPMGTVEDKEADGPLFSRWVADVAISHSQSSMILKQLLQLS